jgi:hypothetical protein
VTVLSDGADGPRSLGEAASPGPARHVLDWFHLSMRVQHVAQTARGWSRGTEQDPQQGAMLAERIERIRWRLWHGKVQKALELIGEILEEVKAHDAKTELAKVYLRRFESVLRELESYVSSQSTSIINYAAAARRSASPPADDGKAADALVAKRSSLHAQSSNGSDEWNLRTRPRTNGSIAAPALPPHNAPTFETVSATV